MNFVHKRRKTKVGLFLRGGGPMSENLLPFIFPILGDQSQKMHDSISLQEKIGVKSVRLVQSHMNLISIKSVQIEINLNVSTFCGN